MTAPLVIEFAVACGADHAFELWTTRTAMWWPRAHTMSGSGDVEIVIEPRVGGRFYERAPDGTEHEWGSITDWAPPQQFSFLWHLGQDPDTATDVTVSFVALDANECRVTIEHRGWERLGADADVRRGRNRVGWETAGAAFVDSVSRAE